MFARISFDQSSDKYLPFVWQKKGKNEFFSSSLKDNITELLITIDGAVVAFEINTHSNIRNEYQVGVGL